MSSIISAEESRHLLLAMSQQRSVTGVLNVLVKGLHERCGAALARVWLVTSTEDCSGCRDSKMCVNQSECLELTASAGQSLDGTEWSNTRGEFTRMPIGFGKVGHIAQTKQAVEEKKIDPHSPVGCAKPEWIEREKDLRSAIGQPLLHQDKLLGVLAVFTRQSPSDDDLTWLRAFADHAAAAIANGRAFEEIQRLRGQLELENEYLRGEVKAACNRSAAIIGESPALKEHASA